MHGTYKLEENRFIRDQLLTGHIWNNCVTSDGEGWPEYFHGGHKKCPRTSKQAKAHKRCGGQFLRLLNILLSILMMFL